MKNETSQLLNLSGTFSFQTLIFEELGRAKIYNQILLFVITVFIIHELMYTS